MPSVSRAMPSVSRALQSIARATPPIVDVVKLRVWLMERSPPSARIMITTAAAGVALVVGITVAMTLG